jgi:hypothetical protein
MFNKVFTIAEYVFVYKLRQALAMYDVLEILAANPK